MTTISHSAVTAAELAASTADKFMFVGNNALESYTSAPKWNTGTTTWADGAADVSDPNYPALFAIDRRGSPGTAPTYDGSVTAYSLLFAFTQGTSSLLTIDTLFILGHNFASLTGNITVKVRIGSDNNLTDYYEIHNTSSQTGDRIWNHTLSSSSLGANIRYTNAAYARLLISTDSGTNFGVAPSVGEIILGRRRQLGVYAEVPWEDQESESDVVDFVSRSGVRNRYTRSKGRRVFTPTFRGGSTNESPVMNTELRLLFEECQWGSQPVICCPKPNSDNQAFFCHFDPPQLSMPILGPFEREVKLNLVETAPYQQLEP